MAATTLDPDDLKRSADSIAERVLARVDVVEAARDHWMDSADAAAGYFGITRHALDKLCAARTAAPFERDKPGGKRWFKAVDLDNWRRGAR